MKTMKKSLLLLLAAAYAGVGMAKQVPALLPQPQSIELSAETGEIDVSKFIAKPGLHEFMFQYRRGAGSFNLLKAELLENGKVVAEDEHAYTGTIDGRSPNQFYLLKLPEYNSAAKYTLRYSIESVKGGCSGVLMLVPPLEAEQYSEQRSPDTKGNVSNRKQPDEL